MPYINNYRLAVGVWGALPYNTNIPRSTLEPVSASVSNPDDTPATSRSIPVFVGEAKIQGTVIWGTAKSGTYTVDGQTYVKNVVAVCFGRNVFQLPITLKELYVSGTKVSLSGVTFFDGIGNTKSSEITSVEGAANTPAFDGYVYLTMKNVRDFNDITAVFENAGASVTLPGLIEKICAYSDIAASDVVTQNLSTYVINGMFLSSSASSVELLSKLAELYSFQFVESDGKLKFSKKRTSAGALVDKTLPADKFVEAETEAVSVTRNSAYNTANSVSVEFLDKDKQYEVSSAKAERPSGNSFSSPVKREVTISTPLAIGLDTAKALSHEALYSMINGSTVYTFALPPEYSYIEPGDLVRVPVEGFTKTLLVTQSVLREDSSNEINATLMLDEASTSLSVDSPYTPVIEVDIADVHTIPLDIPILEPTHDLSGSLLRYYHGFLNYDATKDWVGAWGYKSLDDSDYDLSSTWPAIYPPTLIGTAQNVINAPALPFATDTVNTLEVRVDAGSPSLIKSKAYTDVLNRKNGCAAYGQHGRWEIIAWETVTTLPSGNLVLSGLQRGLLGSEVNWDNHQPDDLFVYINWFSASEAAGRLQGTLPVSQLGQDTWFSAKPPSADYTVDNNKVMRNWGGVAETPYAPVQGKGVLAVSGDVTLSWVRRSRLAMNLLTGSATDPLGEATESYEVDIMDGATVVRTLTSTSQSVVYAAADILTDFGAPQTSLTFRVYQMSAVVGRGYPGEHTVAL